MASDHSDSEKGSHYMGYAFQLAAMVLLYTSSHRHVSPVVEHWLERSGVTVFIFWGAKGGPNLDLGGGGQEDGIAMKDAQSKVK